MSAPDRRPPPPDRRRHRQALRRRRSGSPMLTAYDYPTAQILDEAGIPLLLVGDSLGQVLLGYESTVRVTMAEMLHHTKAVVRGAQRAMVIGDMPFLTYSTVGRSARERRPVPAGGRRPGGQGRRRRPLRTDHRGARQGRHPGHGPHRLDAAGTARDGRQGQGPGQGPDAGAGLLADALAVQEAGAFSIVLELMPAQLAAAITERLRIPTIGIGAGPVAAARSRSSPTCSASATSRPRHARPYADLREHDRSKRRAPTPRTSRPAPSRARPRRSGWTTRSSTRPLGAASSTGGERPMPLGGIPLDRDL